MKGKKRKALSIVHRAKISEAMKGNTRGKGNIGKKGKVNSVETRIKIGASSKGRVHSAETRAKISAFHKGKTFSPEHCAKLRISNTVPDSFTMSTIPSPGVRG